MDKIIKLFNSSGSLAGFTLDDFDMNVNLADSSIFGKLGLSVLVNRYENTYVGAQIGLSTDLDSIRSLALIYAGLDGDSIVDVILDKRRECLELIQRHIRQGDTALQTVMNELT